MRVKHKIIITLLLLLMMPLFICSCNSTDYRYNINRFVGDYQTKPDFYFVDVRLFEDTTHKSIMNRGDWIIDFTENGYYYLTLENRDIAFYERKFDPNLTVIIQDAMKMLGKNVKLKKKEIIFTDSNESYIIENSEYSQMVGDCLEINTCEKEDGSTAFTRGFYYIDEEGKERKELSVNFNKKVQGLDGMVYNCYINLRIYKK